MISILSSCLKKNVIGCAGIKTYSACSSICNRDNVYLCEQNEEIKLNQALNSMSQQLNYMNQQQQLNRQQQQINNQQQQLNQQQNKSYYCNKVGYNQYYCN